MAISLVVGFLIGFLVAFVGFRKTTKLPIERVQRLISIEEAKREGVKELALLIIDRRIK